MVGKPARDVARILCHQGRVPRGHVDAIHVKHLRISLIVLHQYVLRVILQIIDD